MPHPGQEDRPEAFADSWHSATAPRNRATLGSHPLCSFKIYLVKKGKERIAIEDFWWYHRLCHLWLLWQEPPTTTLAKEREGAPSLFPRCSCPFFIIFPSIFVAALIYWREKTFYKLCRFIAMYILRIRTIGKFHVLIF